jgi:hypothetical protein
VQVLNKIVLMWGLAAALAAGLFLLSPSEARTAGAVETKARPAAAANPAKAVAHPGRPKPGVKTAFTSGDAACLTGRRKLWTDDGWIVRRVTSCR